MKAGTQLVCIVDGLWFVDEKKFFFWKKRRFVNGPKKDEIVTFHEYCQDLGYIRLKEYLGVGQFPEKYFKPLISDSELQKEVSSITVPATAYR